MNTDILTLILVPLCIALLVLYLQQLSKVTALRAEKKAAKKEAERLSISLKQSISDYEDALRAAKAFYEGRVEGATEESLYFQKLFLSSKEVIKAMGSAYTELHEFAFQNRWPN